MNFTVARKKTTHDRIIVSPVAAMPAILPFISWSGETEDNRTSIRRFDFSSTVFVNASTRGLWKAITYANNELLSWERRGRADVSVSQGEFPPGDEMAGYAWQREVSDREPLPGIRVRRVQLTLTWTVGGGTQSYRAETYVEPR